MERGLNFVDEKTAALPVAWSWGRKAVSSRERKRIVGSGKANEKLSSSG